ncbi:DNA polymerase Y family protein [Polaromonas sp. C04]|uniref:Y-family DNA polymerase n=1 Tax=Polaromonas sp. C04 TaxID=1945857 RepID=UPI0009CED319|nr:DNA polymerase Y family protein [Polaromonas sp. C04]OOG58186.1 DNA polymerase [Polaromonas sp. C04]
MELEASLRLFGGGDLLRERVVQEAREQGIAIVSWAPTSLAALALARSGLEDGFRRPLGQLLDSLPLESLSAVAAHQPTLARLGCQTLGDVRRLPRGGISRRFDKHVLVALDEAYGLRPAAHDWVVLPESFDARLELPGRVDSAASLMFGAHRLLLQMCGWLAARNAGVTAYVLRWCHDAMRARPAGDGGELIIRTAAPTRDISHLARLLAEHLAKVKLLAPVGDIELAALDVVALEEASKSLLPDTVRAGDELGFVLERIAARLGPERVLRPCVAEDHRVEWMQTWQPAEEAKRTRAASRVPRSVDIPQPSWVLAQPLKLAVAQHRPLYQGPLQLVVGPHRVEGGWWHRAASLDERQVAHNVQRDYWVALSQHAGALWVFQERLAHDDISWYLHGVFA